MYSMTNDGDNNVIMVLTISTFTFQLFPFYEVCCVFCLLFDLFDIWLKLAFKRNFSSRVFMVIQFAHFKSEYFDSIAESGETC